MLMQRREDVPEAVRELLRTVADSFEKLYTLIALFRRQRQTSLDELMTQVQLPEPTLVEALYDLLGSGLVGRGSRPREFVYNAGDGVRDASVAWLSAQFDHASHANVDIVKLLSQTALQRVRAAVYQRMEQAAVMPDAGAVPSNGRGRKGPNRPNRDD